MTTKAKNKKEEQKKKEPTLRESVQVSADILSRTTGHISTLHYRLKKFSDGSTKSVDPKVGAHRVTAREVSLHTRRDGLGFVVKTRDGKEIIDEQVYFCNPKYKQFYINRHTATEILNEARTGHNWKKPISKLPMFTKKV